MGKASFYSNWNVFSTGLLSTSPARDTWVLFVFVAGDFLAKDSAKKKETQKIGKKIEEKEVGKSFAD